ncbi:DNA-directed RNA polymerase subunit beta [compost metagenome]
MPTPAANLQLIFSSPRDMNTRVDGALMQGLLSQFPIEGKNYILTLEDVRAEPKAFTHEDQKDAILKSKSLTYPIKGHIKLIDKATGKVVDENHNFSLMDAFHITDKHTMLYKGNNYSAANQLQLRPGVYTRSRDTGELESHFNTGTGRSFAITLEPQSGMFYINIQSSNIPLAPLVSKVFGIGPRQVGQYIPQAVWDENIKATTGKENKIISDLYSRLVSTSQRKPGASVEEMAMALRTSLENSQLSVQTTKATLGKPIGHVNADAILLALRNLAETHSGDRQEDNRDSLQFKRVQSLPDFLNTRFQKHELLNNIKRKLTGAMDRTKNPTLKDVVVSKPFNKVMSNYILESQLVSTPSETNPIESLESVGKVTVLGAGEGGISSDRGVPMAARDIDPSHLGVIDPSRTPESGHAGIDQRFTISARRDGEGNLYARVIDKAGKQQYLSVEEMMNSAIGFPHQEGKKTVQAQVRGVLKEVPSKDIDYWLNDTTDMYTITTNLVPFLNSNHPGRLTMAGKAIPQALSLVNREIPLVQTVQKDGTSFVDSYGKIVSTVAPVKGTVTSVSNKQVQIKADDDGKIHKITFVKNLPFNMKGFLDDEAPKVKVGDKVVPGSALADNNYTKDGVLALGKNLEVAYMPYKGYNHEDGLVISRTCADSLSSHHAYKVDYDVQDISVMKKALISRYFPGRLTREQLEKLDDQGFAKVGVTLNHGDPVYAVLEKREPTPEDKMLGRLHKTLVTPYRLVMEPWHHDESGSVVDAHTEGKAIRILIRSIKPLEIGDKLTGLHGNKGIVSRILDDHEMPYNKNTGKPVDILLNPASVTSRINLGQLMETAAGKIAQKTGIPYKIHNFGKSSNVANLKDELTAHGLSDTEMLVDPKTGKDIGNILTGPQYFLKLYKTTDQNWSARNVGGYDNVLQPTKGGEEGSKSVGYMEMLGLLGSNARKNLKEIATLKSEENSDYWKKFLTGQPLPKPKTTFATQKFFDYLTGAGIRTQVKDGKITASPLTDIDILAMSNGKIVEPEMLSAKNLEPEKGGLFDPVTTGGLRGNRWTHYELAEPIPNPVFERPIKSILGLKTSEYNGLVQGTIGIKKMGDGNFALHDTSTGHHIKTLNVNAHNLTLEKDEDEIEPEEDI